MFFSYFYILTENKLGLEAKSFRGFKKETTFYVLTPNIILSLSLL